MSITVTVCAQTLKSAVKYAFLASDPDATRYALSGVCLCFDNGNLNIVATDGRRLHLARIPAENWHIAGGTIEQLNLTKATVKFLLGSNKGDTVFTIETKDNFTIDIPKGAGSSAQHTQNEEYGRFPPNWAQVIPTGKPENVVTGNHGSFVEWIKWIADPTPVFHWHEEKTPGECTPRTRYNMREPRGGKIWYPSFTVKDPSGEMSFNPLYLKDAIDTKIHKTENVILEHHKATNSYRIILPRGYEAVIMGYRD